MKTRSLLALTILAAATSLVQAQSGPLPFQGMDSDNDGAISEQEFRQAHEQRMAARAAQGMPMRNAMNAPRFAELDQNGDGTIEPQEMMQFRQQRMQQRWQQPGYGAGAPMMPRGGGFNRPGFADIDSNGDGCINAEELERFQQSRMPGGGRSMGMPGMRRGRGMGMPGMPGMQGGRMGRGYNMPGYQDFDLDNDGAVSEEEFIEARGRRIEQRAKEGRMMRGLASMPQFSDLDSDADGKISAAEFAAHQQSHRQMQRMMPGMPQSVK
ncbi:MAG: EF-hand domain-containing protein [Gammaproteobacteria bacterium]|nr:EF-hand domain-containing protein [Gammaproteobacteria bacterium]